MTAEDGLQTHEYSSRALVKQMRAGELFESLEVAVDRWNNERLIMAPARSPHQGEQRLELFRPEGLTDAPMAVWESIFHDGVHNLRVALDTLCFELCHLEDVAPHPERIHFPITQHPNEWPGRTAHLATMPAQLLDRLKECQPWNRPDPQTPDPLTLVARIDNIDKHRANGVTFDTIPMGQWALRPTEPLPQELADSLTWPLAPWMNISISPPVERGWGALVPVLAVPVVIFEGLFANLPDAQRWLYSEVWRMISFIASGEWLEPGFDRFLPEPTWMTFPGPGP